MSKRLLRILLIPLALSVMTFALIRHYFGSEAGLRGLYAIPGDAIYIIETTEPFNAWDRLSNNPAWQHLKTHPLFNEIAEGADALDSMLHDNPYLTDLIGDRQLLISASVPRPGSQCGRT